MTTRLMSYKKAEKISVLTVFLFSLFLLSCSNDSLNEDQINEIDFSLILLDENQTEARVFEKGTDVTFAVKLVNNSEKDIEWYYSDGCGLFNSEEFLRVYMKNHETNSAYVPIGRPYQWPTYCYAINLPPQIITTKETRVVGAAWSHNPDNQPLGTGDYYVNADFSVTIEGKTRSWNLRTEFEMK